MTQYTFNMGAGPTTEIGALTWNPSGTLQQLQITDHINTANSQTCTFGYDDLVRLTSASCGSVWAQTFGFDPFGNLSKTGSAQFLPTYTGASGTSTSPTNQYYQISGGSSGSSNYYDGNGNLKNDVTHAYTWDADGNMLSTDGSSVTMIYDAMDRMAEQTRSSGHTQIVYGPGGMKLALMNGQTLVNAFVALPGGARAVYNSSGLQFYRHVDHLGSSRLATTPSRTCYSDLSYAPYGEDYQHSSNCTTQDVSFTGENQDTVNGGWAVNLYDFQDREYRTAHGRWTSPDPAGLAAVDPTSPQSWNRYAYAVNNPLAMVDLLGDDACYDGGGGLDGLLGTASLFTNTWNGNSYWVPTSSGPSEDGLMDFFNTGCGNPGGYGGPSGGGFGIFEGENSVNLPVGSGNPLTDLWQALNLPSLPCQSQFGPWCDSSMLPNPWVLDACDSPKDNCHVSEVPCSWTPCVEANPHPIPSAYECFTDPGTAVPELPGSAPEQPDAAPGPPPPGGSESGGSIIDGLGAILGYGVDSLRCWIYKKFG